MTLFLTTYSFTILWRSNADKANNYLILGFVVMWLIGMVYLIYLRTQQNNIRKDIDVLRQLLDDD